MTKLEKFKSVCKKYMVLHDTSHIDVIFGTVFANRLDSESVWTFIIGEPSSGKGIIASLADHPSVVFVDKLTRHSLVSGWKEPNKKSRVKGEDKDFSLVRELQGKILVIKDFTTTLGMRYDDVHEILSTLTSIYDGTFSSKFGHTDLQNYKTKFGIVAACTYEIENHQKLIADIGPRFLKHNMPNASDSEKRERAIKAMRNQSKSEMDEALKEAAHAVLNENPDEPKVHMSSHRALLNVAEVVSAARYEVKRDRTSREPEIPSKEYPTRLSIQLCTLAKGIAMARGKSRVDLSEIRLAQKTALCAITKKRLKLFETFILHYQDWMSVKEISEEMHFSHNAVNYWLQDLLLLNLLDCKTVIRGRHEIRQFRLRNASQIKRVLFPES